MTPPLTLHSRALLAEDRGEALLVGPDHLLVNNLLRELDCRHIEGHVTLALEVVLVADSKVVAVVVIGNLPYSSPPAAGSLDVLLALVGHRGGFKLVGQVLGLGSEEHNSVRQTQLLHDGLIGVGEGVALPQLVSSLGKDLHEGRVSSPELKDDHVILDEHGIEGFT